MADVGEIEKIIEAEPVPIKVPEPVREPVPV